MTDIEFERRVTAAWVAGVVLSKRDWVRQVVAGQDEIERLRNREKEEIERLRNREKELEDAERKTEYRRCLDVLELSPDEMLTLKQILAGELHVITNKQIHSALELIRSREHPTFFDVLAELDISEERND